MTFADLEIGQEFKLLPWRAGGNYSGDLPPGAWRKIAGNGYYNAVRVGSRGREVAYVGLNTKVQLTKKG